MQNKPSKEDIKIAHLAALLLPLRACQSQAKKGKTNPTVSLIIGESMKWKKLYAGHVMELHAQAPVLLEVSQQLQVIVHVMLQHAPHSTISHACKCMPIAGCVSLIDMQVNPVTAMCRAQTVSKACILKECPL